MRQQSKYPRQDTRVLWRRQQEVDRLGLQERRKLRLARNLCSNGFQHIEGRAANGSFGHDIAHSARQFVFAFDALDRHAGRSAETQPRCRKQPDADLMRMPI